MVKSHYSQLFLLAKARHTKIWRFLDAVKSDQNYNEQMQDQLQAGHTKIRQPKSNKDELTKTAIKASFPTSIFHLNRYQSHKNQLRAVVLGYAENNAAGEVKEYLRSCAYHAKIAEIPEVQDEAEEQTTRRRRRQIVYTVKRLD